MPCWNETESAAGPLLDSLQLWPPDLLDFTALDAEKVVVVWTLELNFKAGGAIGGHHMINEPALL